MSWGGAAKGTLQLVNDGTYAGEAGVALTLAAGTGSDEAHAPLVNASRRIASRRARLPRA